MSVTDEIQAHATPFMTYPGNEAKTIQVPSIQPTYLIVLISFMIKDPDQTLKYIQEDRLLNRVLLKDGNANIPLVISIANYLQRAYGIEFQGLGQLSTTLKPKDRIQEKEHLYIFTSLVWHFSPVVSNGKLEILS